MRNGLSEEHRLDQAWLGYDMENRKIIESIQNTEEYQMYESMVFSMRRMRTLSENILSDDFVR